MAKVRRDFISRYTNSNGENITDLEIINGEFTIDFSELCESAQIIECNKGQYRQHGDIGLGMVKNKNCPINSLLIKNTILDELKKDELTPISLYVLDRGVGIDVQIQY